MVKKLDIRGGASGGEVRRFVDAKTAVPGDELRYTIVFKNTGEEVVDAESVVITTPLPSETSYVADSAFGDESDVLVSTDGGRTYVPEAERDDNPVSYIRWTYRPSLAPGASSEVSFNLTLDE